MAGGEGKGSIYLSTSLRLRRRRDKSQQGIESAEQVVIRNRTEKGGPPFPKKHQELSAKSIQTTEEEQQRLRCSSWDGHYSLPPSANRQGTRESRVLADDDRFLDQHLPSLHLALSRPAAPTS